MAATVTAPPGRRGGWRSRRALAGRRGGRRSRRALPALGTLAWALAAAQPAIAYQRHDLTFSVRTIQGSDGTSYVYLDARESGGHSEAVPTRRFVGCPTRFYMRWVNVQRHGDLTSYDVRLYQCQTGQPYDDGISRGGALAWGPGNRMLLAGANDMNTQAEVIYALDVALDPAAVRPGQTATLRAAVAGDFVEQADRTLDISVDPAAWSVASWDVRFGDGQQATAPGGGRSVAVAHRYLAAGPVRPVVTAHVVGMAEAADFDPATGEPILVRQPFAVDVTNSASGTVAAAPAVGYAAPQIRAAVAPRLDASTVPVGATGLAQIEAPRGTAVRLFVRPLVDREGYITLDGVASAPGRSRMVAWRLLSSSGDGPPGTITPAGTSGGPATPIVQQWDSPDRITAAGAQPYEVAVSCTMRTTYPDGQQRDFDLDGIVQVSVGYSASTG